MTKLRILSSRHATHSCHQFVGPDTSQVDPESSSAYRDSRVKEGYGIEMQTTASQYSKEVEAQLKDIGFD